MLDTLDPAVVVSNPLALIQSAIDHGMDPDRLGKLMDLEERWQKARALEAYAKAMNKVQKEMPVVLKDRVNPQTKSNYSTLEAVNAVVKPLYTDNGFSISFGTDTSPLADHVRVVADVHHVGGHYRRYQGDFPLDGAGLKGTQNKTAMHATGSTLSYGRRYLTLLIFNITSADEDTDGVKFLTGDQIGEINDLLGEWENMGGKVDMKRFMAWVGFESLDETPQKEFGRIIDELKRRSKGVAK